MKTLVALAAILAALAFAGQAHASLTGAFGPTAKYRAAFDDVRGQSANGQVGYDEPRTCLEWQSWLTPVGQTPGHHSEHMHIEACVPQGQTWLSPNDARYIDVNVTFHNMLDYKVTNLAATFHYCVPGGSCDSNAHASRRAFDDSDQPGVLDDLTAAAKASAGGATTNVYRSFKLTPATYNGLKEIRLTLSVERGGPGALVERWVLDSRWYATDLYAGLPDGSLFTGARYIRERTIVDFIRPDGTLKTNEYHHAGFNAYTWGRSFFATAKTGTWNVPLRVTDGGGPASLEVNPDHHSHPDYPGDWHNEFVMFSPPGVEALRTEPVPVSDPAIPVGVNRLVFISHDEPDCQRLGNSCPEGTRPTWTNVTAISFKKAA